MHEKRRVDGHDLILARAVTGAQKVRMGVAAQPAVGLVKGDPVASGQQVGGGETGDPTADDRYRASRVMYRLHTPYSERPASRMAGGTGR